MTLREHKCPVVGCETLVPHEKLACPRDWGRLPAYLKKEIQEAYRGRGADPIRHARSIRRAFQWYQRNPRRPLVGGQTGRWSQDGPRPNCHDNLYGPAPKPEDGGQ